MIALKTERLIISDHTSDDLAAMHRLLSDPIAMYYLPDIKTNSVEESHQNLNTAIEETGLPDRKRYYFKIEYSHNHKYIGEIGFTVRIDTPIGKIVNLGYFILPEFQGMGIVTEAAREVIRFAFKEANVIKIETGCIKENRASEKVMIKLGMKKEAEYQSHVWHDNQLKDRVEYGLPKEQWSPCPEYNIREINENDKENVVQLISESWGSHIVVSKGVAHDTSSLPGFIAESGGKTAGLIIYNISGNKCEIVVLESFIENRGIGGRLIEKVIGCTKETCCKVWLITTNDNTNAIRFYQKRGFILSGIHIDAIKKSREMKPQIPLHGFDGIPILHEIEFEKRL